ncbi:MAG: PocR ligand-binding domain-containing protein [Clostridia bacterium]|nr:PocR ligand-binding domain-containing protein [Clostridia bacterium]
MSLGINITQKEVESVLEKFYKATGISVCIYDLGLEPVIEYPEKSTKLEEKNFCDVVQDLSSTTRYKCLNCINKAIDQVCQSKEPYIYKCHFGFIEIIIPIIIYGDVVAYVKTGPIRSNSSDKYEFERIMSWISDFELNESTSREVDSLKNSFSKIKVSEKEKIEAFSFLLYLCVQYICSNHWLLCEERNLIDDFELYISNNIRKDLSIADVSVALKISRSHLSRIIQLNKNMTFTDYVLNKKVDEAKRLLLTTSMSVNEIAEVLNFKEPTYFMRVFKNKTGYTCTVYRKRFIS